MNFCDKTTYLLGRTIHLIALVTSPPDMYIIQSFAP